MLKHGLVGVQVLPAKVVLLVIGVPVAVPNASSGPLPE